MNDTQDLLDRNLETILSSRVSSGIDPNATGDTIQPDTGIRATMEAAGQGALKGVAKYVTPAVEAVGGLPSHIASALLPGQFTPAQEQTMASGGAAAARTLTGVPTTEEAEGARTLEQQAWAGINMIPGVAGLRALAKGGKVAQAAKDVAAIDKLAEVNPTIAKHVAGLIEPRNVLGQTPEGQSIVSKLDNYLKDGTKALELTPEESAHLDSVMPGAEDIANVLHDAAQEAGGVSPAMLIVGTRALAGGIAGGTVGASDVGGPGTTYDTVKDALIGAGLGAIAGPKTIQKLLPVLKSAEASVAVTNRPTFKLNIGGGGEDVLYHGTSADVKTLDVANAGSGAGNPTSGWGLFFTPSKQEANRYVSDFHGGKGQVIPATVNLTNPYKMPFAEYEKFVKLDLADKTTPLENQLATRKVEADAFKAKLVQDGYDGIIVGVPGKARPQEIVAFSNNQVTQLDPKSLKVTTVGINLNKLDSPERIGAALERVKTAQREAGVIEGLAPGSRGVVTDDMAATLGQQLGLSADDVMARIAGSAHPVEDVFAYSALLNNHYTQRLVPLASQVAAGSETAVAEMQKALAEYRLMGHQFSGVAEESGRSLRAFGLEEIKGAKATLGKVGDIAELAEQTKVIPPQVLATAILEAGKTPAILQAFNQTEKLGFNWPTFTKVLYANLLSSPATHIANVLGNTVASALETGERFIAETLFAKAADGRIGLNEIGVQKGEAIAMAHSFASTVLDGIKFTASSLKDGDLGRIIEALPSQAGAKGITGVEGPGAIQSFSDVLSAGLAVPTKLLGIEDGIARALNQNAAVRAYAVRQGVNLGKKGADLDDFVSKVIANPPTNILKAAEADALKSTFNNPSPEWLQGIEKLTGDYPVLKVVLPFIRTPYNLANYAVQRIPGVNYALSAEYRADLAAGGARRQLAISKNISGSMIAGTIGYLTLQGKVTGAGPDNPELRKVWLENHQPYSINMGGKWYSYNRLDPVAMLIGTTADITSQMMGAHDKDAAYIAEVVGLAFSRNIASKTWFKSASDFLDLFNPKQSDTTDTFGKRVENWGGNVATQLIPFSAGVGSVNRAFFDDTARQTADALDKVKAKLPYFSKTLPAKLSYFAEPIIYDSAGPDIVSPIYTMDVKKNQVVSEIVKNRAPVPRIPTTGPSGDALTAQEIHDLIKTMNRPEGSDQSLHDALADAIKSPEYQSLPGPEVTNEGKPSGRGAYLAEITRGYYNQAIAELANKKDVMDPENHFSGIKKDSDLSRRMTGTPIVPPTTHKGFLDNLLPKPAGQSGGNQPSMNQ